MTTSTNSPTPELSLAPGQDSLSTALRTKQDALLARFDGVGRVMIAFSGGVDSSYLGWAAHRALGADCLLVTAVSPSYPASHRAMAEQLVSDFDLPHCFVDTHEMERSAYRANGPDRCYHCKSELFDTMDRVGRELGFDRIAYGVNTDDTTDYRPGHRAADEHHVMSPLQEVGLSKREIRELSRGAGLPTADLPASACLSSRLPYGTEVTIERLGQVERGEEILREMGFRQLRLRHHGELARIEIDPVELPRALEKEMTDRIVRAIKPLGFRYVTLDLEGYRMGSLNEVLQIHRDPIR